MSIFEDQFGDVDLPKVLLCAMLVVIVLGIGCCWYACKREALLLNKTYNTKYTTADIFWAGDVVSKIIQGNTVNINIKEKK